MILHIKGFLVIGVVLVNTLVDMVWQNRTRSVVGVDSQHNDIYPTRGQTWGILYAYWQDTQYKLKKS